QQALAHTVALDGGERRIFGCDLTAIEKLEAADLQGVRLVVAESVDPHVELLGKEHGGVPVSAVGGEIVRAEPERSLISAGAGSVRGEPEQERDGELGVPVPPLAAL